MAEIQQANTQPDSPKKANKHPLKAAIALYKAMPIGLRRIAKATAGAVGILVVVTILHHNLPKAIFLTGSLLNLSIIVAVVIQAYIYIGQWDVMKRTVKAAEDNTLYSQRAYISVTPEPYTEVHFKLRVENSGNTPAYGVEIFVEVDSVPEGKPVPFERESHWHDPLGVIGPRCAYTKTYGVHRLISGPEMSVLRDEKARFYCWGVVTYRDIFASEKRDGRRTWFCFYKPMGDKDAYPHEEGNNAT